MNLIKISRPRFWLYTAGPFMVGAAAASTHPAALLSIHFFIGLLYFLIPANIFLYGINDLADRDTDAHNKKKSVKEHRLHAKETRALAIAVGLSTLLGIALALTQHTLVLAFTAAYLVLGAAYSIPPTRFKKHPFIDSASNILYIMPGIVGYTLVSGTLPPLWAVLAGWAWAWAMHLYSAIPDIAPDKKAGLHTTAVVLGHTVSLALTGILWTVCAALIAFYSQPTVFLVALTYPVLATIILVKKLDVEKMYWYYPYINALAGMIVFWMALI